ncbi:MAG: hypothetical protein LLG44_14475 [Chloroflexi bacterium]|nr:hypothetical protein [Chloroflexota bacterium]
MSEPILNIARNVSVILLSIEAIAVSAVVLVLFVRLLQYWRKTRPKAKNGIHEVSQTVLKYSLKTRQVAQQVSFTTAKVRSVPQGMRAGLRSILRSKHKEAPRV